MLYNIFYIILKMSCSTFVVAILLLSVKYVLQKFGFPRKITFFLWAVIAYRLICPVSIQTDISMFNIASTFYKQNYTVEVQVKDTTNRTSDVIRYVTKPSENNYSGEQIKTINKASPLWRQILADALDLTLVQKENSDSSLGSAMLAGVAAGFFASPQAALDQCTRDRAVTTPNGEMNRLYEERSTVYRAVHDALAPLYNQ